MQGKRQIKAPGHGHVELPDRLNMSVQSVQVRLDMGTPHLETGIRDQLPVFLIICTDILDQVMEFPLR